MNESEIREKNKELYRLCVSNYLRPESERLPDYNKAQKIILQSIQILENQFANLKKSNESNKSLKIIELQNHILLFKDFGNTIAWYLTGENETDLRAYYGAGPKSGMVKDTNLQFEHRILEHVKDVPDVFVLLCDITTTINIGDVMLKKAGLPPLNLELKEGEINKKLTEMLHDEESLSAFVESVDPSKRKTTERQIKRLKSQKRRIDHLNAYLADDSLRHDEQYDFNTMIIKPSKRINPSTFSKQLNQTYSKLEPSGIKTIKIRGGLYALVTKKPENYDDHIHFRHMVYHKINNLNFSSDCMISSHDASSNFLPDELRFMQSLEVYGPLQGLGNSWFKPIPASFEELDEDFAIALLNRDASLYFAIDPNEFFSNFSRYGMSWKLKKPSNHPFDAKASFLVNGKKVAINGTAVMSKNFLEYMFRSFYRPSYEIKMMKEMIQRVDSLTEDELARFAKKL